MKRGTLLITIVALCALGNAACGGGHHHTPPPPATTNFVFYVSGEDILNGGDFYSLAGVYSITADGTVTAGEQDYNDGDGFTSPQPGGDLITSGSLVMNADGSGTGILTLNTNNAALGVGGTETFAVAFPNSSHALITQFDGSATSSGSLDLQTATSPSDGAYSFTAAGTDINFNSVVDGGVLTSTAGAVAGTVDINDDGTVTLNTAFTGAFGTSDAFGRGTFTNDGNFPTSFNYYVVGPECVRVIDVDETDTAVGSVYGQGGTSFSNASIGQSVFSIGASLGAGFYAGAGQFTTDAGLAVGRTSKPRTNAVVIPEGGVITNAFVGVGDINELDGSLDIAVPVSGTYAVAADGYGSMAFDVGFGDVATFGVYAVDPALNIQDPNNASDGGGALVAEMDGNLIGTGVIIPQTDTTVSSFGGSYAFGATGNTDIDFDEFDFLGTATVDSTDGDFAGVGSLSDPFAALLDGGFLSNADSTSFTGTAIPDETNVGRYTITPVLTDPSIDGEIDLDFSIYQASGGQLLWVNLDGDSGIEAGGSLQQFPGTGADAKKAKPNIKKH